MSLKQYLVSTYGECARQQVNALEKSMCKQAKVKNHLIFMIRLRDNNIIPQSLRTICPVQTGLGREITRRYHKRLLLARITDINNQKRLLSDSITNQKSNLQSLLSQSDYNKVLNIIEKRTEFVFTQTKNRHMTKLTRLLSQQSNQQSESTPTNWVKNISDTVLTDGETKLLSKGLNFSVTPRNIPNKDLIASIEMASSHLPQDEARILCSRAASIIKNARPPNSNISKEESQAIKSLKEKTKEDIIILNADKGNCTVVMNQSEYNQKINELLQTNAYHQIEHDPTVKIEGKLQRLWRSMKNKYNIPYKEYMKIYPSGSTCPRLYGLPKVHKPNVPLRPIVSGCGSVSHSLARLIADILKPLAGNTNTFVKNSSEFASLIRNTNIEENEDMVSFDVESLYTSIPVDSALQAVETYLHQDMDLGNRTILDIPDILSLLKFCLKNTYFSFKGKFYEQVQGLAMGSPASPVVANIFMEIWEERALSSCPLDIKPRMFRRYMDDTFTIIPKGKAEELKLHLNSINPHIKLTVECEALNRLPFLDTLVTRKHDGGLITSVYRKPTHTDRYLNFASHHPSNAKRAVVHSLMDRAKSIPSNPEHQGEEIQHVESTLINNGYPKQFIRNTMRNRGNNNNNEPDNQPITTAVLPYIQGTSERLVKVLKEYNIRGVMKTSTIKQQLSKPKDKIEMESRVNIVYKIPCNDCDLVYIGESGRRLSTRLAEHKECVNNISKHTKSALGTHRYEHDHLPNWDDVSILDTATNYKHRKIIEALHIAEHNTMNRDEGIQIDPIWLTVNQSHNGT